MYFERLTAPSHMHECRAVSVACRGDIHLKVQPQFKYENLLPPLESNVFHPFAHIEWKWADELINIRLPFTSTLCERRERKTFDTGCEANLHLCIRVKMHACRYQQPCSERVRSGRPVWVCCCSTRLPGLELSNSDCCRLILKITATNNSQTTCEYCIKINLKISEPSFKVWEEMFLTFLWGRCDCSGTNRLLLTPLPKWTRCERTSYYQIVSVFPQWICPNLLRASVNRLSGVLLVCKTAMWYRS